MQRKTKLITGLVVILLLVGLGFTSFQLVKAKQEAKLTSEQLTQQTALLTWKAQYQPFLKDITLQSIQASPSTVIFWTENVTKEGRVILHGSVVVNGVVYDSQQTNDVTDYLKK